jgi:thioredoxin-related protein
MTRTKIVSCCLLFLFTLPALAQKEGIRFFKGSWKKAQEEAKQSGKLIFIHARLYFSTASERLVKEVFPLKELGDKYNQHFINYEVDMERGTGRSLQQEFQVTRHPAYLFINGDGDLVYMAYGYTANPKRFLILADTALRRYEEGKVEVFGRATYENRKQDRAFLVEYLKQFKQQGIQSDSASKVLDQYFSLLKPKELKDTAIASFLLNMLSTVRSSVFEHLISQQPFYNTVIEEFPKLLGNVILNSFSKAIDTNDDPLFWDALIASKKLENSTLRYPVSVFMFTNQYYVKKKQVKRVIERAPVFLDRICLMKEEEILSKDRQQFEELMYPYVSGEKDSALVWNFALEKNSWRTVYSKYVAHALLITADIYLQNTRNKTDLRKACIWAEKGVELDRRNYKYYPVLSRLYAKAGMKREAIAAMQSAITMAQEQNAAPIVIAIYKRALQEL